MPATTTPLKLSAVGVVPAPKLVKRGISQFAPKNPAGHAHAKPPGAPALAVHVRPFRHAAPQTPQLVAVLTGVSQPSVSFAVAEQFAKPAAHADAGTTQLVPLHWASVPSRKCASVVQLCPQLPQLLVVLSSSSICLMSLMSASMRR